MPSLMRMGHQPPLERRCERAREIVGPSRLQGVHLETQHAGCFLRVPQLPGTA